MAVHQTREFFMNRDGCIVDNKEVGPTLAEQMWSPGNSEAFLDLVKNLILGFINQITKSLHIF